MNRALGKTAIITGGASGIGAESARRLAEEGAKVVVADVNYSAAQKVADEIGESAHAVELDVTDGARWTAVIQSVEADLGSINVLVNSAGVASYAPIETLDEAEYRRVVDINQVGTFLGIKAVIPALRRAGGGSIVNVSSLAGLIGLPQAIAYSASKWAVRGMTKSAAAELGHEGIRVNSVHPGVIDTPILDDAQGLVDQVMPQLPLGRIGRADEVANMILFLATDESSYTTGTEFAIDGGWHVS
jgi:3alpha(or 20beta)-hydroxysteroid dehydrogenase